MSEYGDTPIPMFAEAPATCDKVMLALGSELKIVRSELHALKERVAETEGQQRDGQSDLDGHVDGLRERIREVQDDIIVVIRNHADEDTKAMREIRDQLLARVPAWALAVMSLGASLIGAMLTWILDHLK